MPTAVREQVRASGGSTWSRRLSPTSATAPAGCVSIRALPPSRARRWRLGIGASTAIFSAVNPILFEPLPYPHAERIADDLGSVAATARASDVTFGTYRELAERSRSFDAMAVFKLVAADDDRRGRAGASRWPAVSAELLPRLGVSPRAGPRLSRADDRPAARASSILSDGCGGGGSAATARSSGGRSCSTEQLHRHRRDAGAGSRTCSRRRRRCGHRCSTTCRCPAGREWGHHLRMVGTAAARASSARPRAASSTQIARDPVPEFARPPWASLSTA